MGQCIEGEGDPDLCLDEVSGPCRGQLRDAPPRNIEKCLDDFAASDLYEFGMAEAPSDSRCSLPAGTTMSLAQSRAIDDCEQEAGDVASLSDDESEAMSLESSTDSLDQAEQWRTPAHPAAPISAFIGQLVGQAPRW